MNGTAIRICQVILLGLSMSFPTLHAQSNGRSIIIDTTYNPASLVSEVLLGNRIKARNVRYIGSKLSIARFIDPSEKPLISDGIVLTTGRTREVPGPNIRPGTGINLGGRGDRSLEHISRGPTYDAAILEFEFMASEELLTFNFVFASEEYTEYVFSQFNDVFAFFISGPGINGIKNLAVVPSNKSPITVNTVNHMVNSRNYIDNNSFDRKGNVKDAKVKKLDQTLLDAIEFDGMTTLLKAQTRVAPGKVYKIRIAIADVGDGRFDSAVFLEAGSFTSLPRDPIKRKEIVMRESANVRRRFDPVTVGEDPLPAGSAYTEDSVPSSPDETDHEGWKRVVNFEFDQAILDEKAKTQLSEAAAQMKSTDDGRIRILGHTDDRGSKAYNERLSRRRAEAVKAYLRGKGVAADRMKVEWYGYERPVNANETDDGRARNRRVEVVVE
jgi:outer membrane protein OmpA-like peptidoglycan-associated protein